MPRKKKRAYDEDLFKDSTMTFGEHLEELRTCLFKALLGLVVGFLAGLAASPWVVNFIQEPLESARKEYDEKQAAKNTEAKLDELRDAGYTLPDDPEQIAQFVAEEGWEFEEVYINPHELLALLRNAGADKPGELPVPPRKPASTPDQANPNQGCINDGPARTPSPSVCTSPF